jgi:hypothetical protein
MPADNYTLFTTADLVNELRKYSNAYALIYVKHDEDIGPNAIRTQINCFETAKMQVFGLTAKLNWWLKDRLKLQNKSDNTEQNDAMFLNIEGKEILEVLKTRCNAGVAAVVFKNNHEVLLLNWESAKGQSIGLATELYEKIMVQ